MVSTEASWWNTLNLKIYTTLGYIVSLILLNLKQYNQEFVYIFENRFDENSLNCYRDIVSLREIILDIEKTRVNIETPKENSRQKSSCEVPKFRLYQLQLGIENQAHNINF